MALSYFRCLHPHQILRGPVHVSLIMLIGIGFWLMKTKPLYPASQPTHLLLSLPIINQPDPQLILPLRNQDPPHIIPLPIHKRKTPHLLRGPPLLLVHHSALDMHLPVRSAFLGIRF